MTLNQGSARQSAAGSVLALLLLLLFSHLPAWAQQTGEKPASVAPTASPAGNPVDSEDDLRRAIQDSGGSENRIILNLEDYLRRYPKSARRAEIEGEIFKLASRLRDRDRTISYAEKMVADDDKAVETLTTLISELRERRKGDDLERALKFADRLVRNFEQLVANSAKPPRVSSAQWQERKDQGLASVYLIRGRVLVDLVQFDRARGDLRKSYDLSPLAGAAIMLSELAEKQNRPDEALDYALRAFAIALATSEEVDLRSLRRRLTTLYTAGRSGGSESGLGDRLLRTYDTWLRERDERLAKLEEPKLNPGVTDPMAFRLTRLDGAPLEMSSLRGRIVVMNFWATWCGPCRIELPLFQKAVEQYRDDAEVTFIAVTTDDDRKLVPEFIRQNKYKLPVAFAEGIDELFGITSIPTTIILNREGEISFKIKGFNPDDDFVAALAEKIETVRKESAKKR